MTTPILDFVRRYADSGTLRLHMPGHKGVPTLGCEGLDITEVAGADSLYAPTGVIRESEANATAVFASRATLYSTEGSSQCIRAMLALALRERKPKRILAGRNAHRSFLSACALCGAEPDWLWPEAGEGLLSCTVRPETLARALDEAATSYAAVYVTSPDYLGRLADVSALAAVCHERGLPLLVDNAHGACLRFLPGARHPLEQGADLVCDSAHKTLPVLTGGAYLHLSRSCPAALLPMAEQALALFASTSPSWLILQSLDAANALLAGEYPARIAEAAAKLDGLKTALLAAGWTLTGQEPLKLTLRPKARGYTGEALAALLRERGIVAEFADPDHLVLMVSAETEMWELDALQDALLSLPALPPIRDLPPALPAPRPVLSPRQALLSPFETVPAEKAPGRILASPSVGCPPAVPIAVCGERLSEEALALFRYYGVNEIDVILE